MNELGLTLVWCAVQVTVFGTVAGLLYLSMRRRSPASRSTVLTSTLLSVILLSVLAWSPWPRWIGTPTDEETTFASASSLEDSNRTKPLLETKNSRPETLAAEQSSMSLFLGSLWDEMKRAPVEEEVAISSVGSWQRIVAWCFLAGVSLGILRLFSGLIAVRKYRATSELVNSTELAELLDVVRAELCCVHSVEIREADTVSSPATVGWRNPIVLLPREWRNWSTSEQRAVLAHEVAHIRRFDFPAWIVAQFGVVLHFYNPVVHWLAGRLRLEQELAADAAAAAVVGGNRVYLQTLAGMAIRQDDRRLSWAARTFLPSHHTFLRRIEMLRHRSPLAARLSVVGRTFIACSLIGCRCVCGGVEITVRRRLPSRKINPTATEECRCRNELPPR